jgi:hypothetical protein
MVNFFSVYVNIIPATFDFFDKRMDMRVSRPCFQFSPGYTYNLYLFDE